VFRRPSAGRTGAVDDGVWEGVADGPAWEGSPLLVFSVEAKRGDVEGVVVPLLGAAAFVLSTKAGAAEDGTAVAADAANDRRRDAFGTASGGAGADRAAGRGV